MVKTLTCGRLLGQPLQSIPAPSWPVIFSDYIYLFGFNKINLWQQTTVTINIFYAITLYIKHKLFHKEKSNLKFEQGFSIVFAAILLSQFNSCPRITIATDEVITTTDDVIHIICIDLEGKLMCCLFSGQKILHFKFIFQNYTWKY